MNKLEKFPLAILKDLKNIGKTQKFFRVFGTLDKIFQISTLIIDENNTKQSKYLLKIKEELQEFVEQETFLGLLEYKGDFLILNLDKLGKESNFIERKKYFFMGEIIEKNDVLMMIPNYFTLVEEDLDLFVYEKTVELLQNHVYK